MPRSRADAGAVPARGPGANEQQQVPASAASSGREKQKQEDIGGISDCDCPGDSCAEASDKIHCCFGIVH